MKKNDFFSLPEAQQRMVLEQAAIRHNLAKQAVEKDLWVTAIIQIIFTLPCADSLVFKGGTSLSKVWGLINRFSEDIDLAIDRTIFNLDGELTKKKVKRLRKESSEFVRDELYRQLSDAIGQTPLNGRCTIEPQPDGDGTYPEPRTIFVRYQSLFADQISYLSPIVKVEAGSRSLLEPTESVEINSLIETALPTISTTVASSKVKTAIAEKTFLEKAFLLHELFSTGKPVEARRRSRHIYDLHMMMQKGLAENAIANNELWETIHHHRATLTSMQGVDYTPDIRDRIQLVPPTESMASWKNDYEETNGSMIYNNPPSFEDLLESMDLLEHLFRQRS